MTQLKYIGSHRPMGMIIDVDEDAAKTAIESGEFVEVGKEVKVVEKKIVKKKIYTTEDYGKHRK